MMEMVTMVVACRERWMSRGWGSEKVMAGRVVAKSQFGRVISWRDYPTAKQYLLNQEAASKISVLCGAVAKVILLCCLDVVALVFVLVYRE